MRAKTKEKEISKAAAELAGLITLHGCRVTVPYMEPSPITIMFDSSFDSAEFIPAYPATMHIYGIDGHICVSCIKKITELDTCRYAVVFGDKDQRSDMLIYLSD